MLATVVHGERTTLPADLDRALGALILSARQWGLAQGQPRTNGTRTGRDFVVVNQEKTTQILHQEVLPALGRMIEAQAAYLSAVHVDLDALQDEIIAAIGRTAAQWARENKREVS